MELPWTTFAVIVTVAIPVVSFGVWVKLQLSKLTAVVEELLKYVKSTEAVIMQHSVNNFGYDAVKDRMVDFGLSLQDMVKLSMAHSEKTLEALNKLLIAIKDLEIAIKTMNKNSRG